MVTIFIRGINHTNLVIDFKYQAIWIKFSHKKLILHLSCFCSTPTVHDFNNHLETNSRLARKSQWSGINKEYMLERQRQKWGENNNSTSNTIRSFSGPRSRLKLKSEKNCHEQCDEPKDSKIQI